MAKPMLIGTDNPHSADPRMALSPFIVGTTGWRTWKMLNEKLPHVTWRDYMDAFHRTNLEDQGTAWCGTTHLGVSTQVLLGDKVRRHFKLPKILLHPIHRDGFTYRQVPHPSGRCRFYNDPAQRALVAQLLADLYRESMR